MGFPFVTHHMPNTPAKRRNADPFGTCSKPRSVINLLREQVENGVWRLPEFLVRDDNRGVPVQVV